MKFKKKVKVYCGLKSSIEKPVLIENHNPRVNLDNMNVLYLKTTHAQNRL